jgi:hypothetical protein
MFETINLPVNPANYYGNPTAVTNIQQGDLLYIGDKDNLEEMIVQSFIIEDQVTKIITDKAMLVASRTTRVNRR